MSVLKVYLSQQWAAVVMEELQGKEGTNRKAPFSQVLMLLLMKCCYNGSLFWHFFLFLKSLCVTSTSMWGWWGFFTSGDLAQSCCSQPPSLVRSILQNTSASFEKLFTLKQITCGMTWEKVPLNISLLTNVYIFKNLTNNIIPAIKFVCFFL